MPFTFSHPAIVLPFAKLPARWVSFTGLVLGSMSPDFEYFLRVEADGIYGHELHGFFWLDLPLCVLVAFLFHNLVRNPLIDHLPPFLGRRLQSFREFRFAAYFRQHWLVFLLSSLAGILTHIFWDSFTHEENYFAQQIAFLQQTVTLAGQEVKTVKVAQHGCSVLGLLVILGVLLSLPAAQEQKQVRLTQKLQYWLVVLAVTLLVVAAAIATGMPVSLAEIEELVVATITGGWLGLMAASFWAKKQEPAR